MTTLTQIAAHPQDYLGASGNPQEDAEHYDAFIAAVEHLIASGWEEDAAIAHVWNDGDWVGRALTLCERVP